ncbi:zinc knuckle domain-containing protein [Ditylenchus destructor]|uniref:Zinc knuckle domain-containing protein n=1 Tax=Ditylenchus destructor TaxID=166010 RepID=A0AAD4MW27_9BILA|nr:zinc knuckle domain-containing protein [Ditylenchus destructor]
MTDCYRCHEKGHFARECTEPERERDRGGRGGDRNDRGESGHYSRDCPDGQRDRRGGGGGDRRGGGDRACYNCQETGHLSRDCPRGRDRD